MLAPVKMTKISQINPRITINLRIIVESNRDPRIVIQLYRDSGIAIELNHNPRIEIESHHDLRIEIESYREIQGDAHPKYLCLVICFLFQSG